MNRTLSTRDRQVLAIGLATCGALIVGTRGIPALMQWTRSTRTNASQLVAEAARAGRSVSTASATRDTLAQRNARYALLALRLLGSETTAGAGGTLASLVSEAAAVANVKLGSLQIRADTAKRGAFTVVSVRADLTGDVRGLAAMLATLERGRTLFAIRELSISQPEPAAGDDRAEVLRAELVGASLMVTPRGDKR